jgi:glycerol-3-phosphate acyltransferase PlsX
VKVQLSVDVQGGDLGTAAMVAGTVAALRCGGDEMVTVLCGDQAAITAELDATCDATLRSRIAIVHCSQSICEQDAPSLIWKNKTDSSLVQCITLQKEGRVQGSVSAGNTGMLLSTALFVLGRRYKNVRPALATLMPTVSGRSALLLDAGANLECKSGHLISFARMGFDYFQEFSGKSIPSVALLNIGSERTKGTRAIVQADQMLRQTQPGYCGFIESCRVLSGDVDVVVCDGFAGNVVLKAFESFYSLAESVLQDDPQLLQIIQRRMAVLNAENYGSAPLLGVNGTVMKAHGSSSVQAMANAILAAARAVRRGEPLPNIAEPAKGN